MNFKRIEWIFLVAFIVLDFFLMTTYFHQDSIVESTTNTSTQDSTASLMKSLKNDQISHGKLSDKSQSGYYLAAPKDGFLREKATQLRYVTWSYSNHKLTASFITGIRLNLTNPQNSLDSVVKDAAEVPMGKHYSFNDNLSTKNTIVYTQELYGKPVYSSEGQIRFTVKDGYVTGYTQTYIHAANILREKKDTISQKRALMWLYQYNKLPQNSTVEWCKLGYTKLLDVNNSVVYIPTWNFCISSKASGTVQYRRINAFTGAVMDETIRHQWGWDVSGWRKPEAYRGGFYGYIGGESVELSS